MQLSGLIPHEQYRAIMHKTALFCAQNFNYFPRGNTPRVAWIPNVGVDDGSVHLCLGQSIPPHWYFSGCGYEFTQFTDSVAMVNSNLFYTLSVLVLLGLKICMT